MKADFSITVDPSRDLLHLTMGGFFAASDIARFVAARNKAHQQLRCAPHAHLTLVDIREMDIQSQEAVNGFHDVLADPTFQSRRLAFVVSRSLARMQIKRAADTRSAGYFLNYDEAERWLLAA